jgi:O-antigen/teichoic acid export membrane protein
MKALKNLLQSQIFRGSFIILTASTLANFINYLYHLFAGRLLGPEQYGLLSGFIGVTYFLGVLTSTFSISIVNLLASGKKDQIAPFIRLLEKKIIKITLPLWLFFFLLFPFFKNILHFESFSLFFVYSLQLFFVFLPIIYSAALQARLKFFHLALITILNPLVKFFSALFFIRLGTQVLGALSGLVAAGLSSLFLGKVFTKKLWPLSSKVQKPLTLSKNFWSYSTLVLVTSLSLTSLISTDLILARFYLPSFESGLYSAAGNLGKIIYFTAFSILTVTFPLFIKHKNNSSRLKSIFHLALFITGSICLAGTLLYYLFPQLIINFLYGQTFTSAGSLVFPVALSFSLYTFFNLLVQILLSQAKKTAAYLTVLAALSQILILTFYHSTPAIFIQNNIFILSLACLLTLFPVAKIIYVRSPQT